MTYTMEDVRKATGTNGMTAVSTFAGSGGSSTGHRLAGFKMALANEFVDLAADTYSANKAPYTIVDRRDIRTITAEDLLNKINLDVGELDLLDGSPPCSAFSTAGKRQDGWGKSKAYSTGKQQVVDDLFFEYATLVRGVQPKAFIAENVTGLVKGTAKGYFKMILKELENCGYNVRAYVIDAHRSGVPQERQRLIFMGARNDLGVVPTPPKKMQSIPTIGNSFPYMIGAGNGKLGVTKQEVEGKSFIRGLRSANRPLGTLGAEMSFPGANSPSCLVVTDKTNDPYSNNIDPETGYLLSLPNSRSYDLVRRAAKRLYGDKGNLRYATLGELRTFAGFPSDFKLTGTYQNRLERVGRAVPPIMMKHISSHLAETVLTRK